MASSSTPSSPFYNSLPPSHRGLYKSYARTINKLCVQCSRKDFLRRCKKFGLHPTHIQNTFRCINGLLESASPYRGKLQKAMDRFKRTILNIEISDTFHNIKKLEKTKATLTSKITQVSPSNTYTHFFDSQETFFQRKSRSLKITTNRKFQHLLERVEIEKANKLIVNESWIKNMTNINVPHETMVLLGYGPKFALPLENNQEIPYFKIIADLESILKLEPDECLQMASRNQFINIIQNHIHKRKNGIFTPSSDPINRFLIEAFHSSKKFVRDNLDVYVVAADKGNKTVLMNKNDYESKMKALVEDSDTYERIDSDWTNKMQTKNNTLVKALHDQKLIDQHTRTRLTTYNATCPKIYGLPKIHKEGNPLRVILSCINCPTYDLSKYLASILHQAIDHDKYNVRSSYEFCTFINNVTLPPNYVLVSFDVVSLFTCIPRDLAVLTVENNWSLIEKYTSIKNKDAFVKLIEFNLHASYFIFRGAYYRQKSGTAMGNPLSPALADMVMNALLDDVLAKIDIPVPFVKKYVDDLLTVLPADKIEYVKNALNAFNPHIQFTYEVENDNRLPYLDMVLIRTENQTILTDWYKKPMASGRILNYFSLHPLVQKLNTATGFIGRIFRLSTSKSIEEKKQTVREHLLTNNYPSSLINRLINRFVYQSAQSISDEVSPEPKVYRSLHHVEALTPALAKVVNRNFKNVTLSFKCVKTNRSLFTKLKDSSSYLSTRNVVYRIPCVDCDRSYIGMTTQQLKNRLAGHRSLMKRYEEYKTSDRVRVERDEEFKKTALMKHAIEEEHCFDIASTKIIDSDDRIQALQILEMCHIACDRSAVNYRTDTNNLSIAYTGILQSIT